MNEQARLRERVRDSVADQIIAVLPDHDTVVGGPRRFGPASGDIRCSLVGRPWQADRIGGLPRGGPSASPQRGCDYSMPFTVAVLSELTLP
jgi:hypothetical protein